MVGGIFLFLKLFGGVMGGDWSYSVWHLCDITIFGNNLTIFPENRSPRALSICRAAEKWRVRLITLGKWNIRAYISSY
jgi:hypothetical protein